eukprot:Gb_31465 [translate_table: standard]
MSKAALAMAWQHHYVMRGRIVWFGSCILNPLQNPPSPLRLVLLRVDTHIAEIYRGIDINGYVRTLCKQGQLKEALDTLYVMDQQCFEVGSYTYASFLRGCVNKKALPEGKLVHAHMIETGFRPDILLGNNLVTMYAKCRSLVDARRVLDDMPQRNVVSWTAMIAACARHTYDEEALALFYQMQQNGVRPNHFTFASVLPACANLAALEKGKEVHEDIIRSGFQSDVFVASALVDMYVKCGSIENARKLFDKMLERNVVSWNAMIGGYAQNGYVFEAVDLFQMMPERNVVSWTVMIAGYAQYGHSDEALKLYLQMQVAGVKPDSDTFASVLPACANLAALEHGKNIHEDIVRSGFQYDVFVGSALVDMYGKCGSIENAQQVFDKMPTRNVVTWTAMIVGYAMHGRGKDALLLFEQMQHSGTYPDNVTFVGVLSACCHAGLVEDGWKYFDCMSRDYHIKPSMEHYCCMVDLLGRAGYLEEAQDFINKMPIKPDASVWASLLGACRIHANIEQAERVAEFLFELEPNSSAHYALLSNIYAAAGRWADIEKVQKMMKERRVKKMPGSSWIEANNKMKEQGYVADKRFVLQDVEAEQKEHILCHHSEKLAIAFGLVNIPRGAPIRIVKNL